MRAVASLLALGVIAPLAQAQGLPEQQTDRVPLRPVRGPKTIVIEIPGERPRANQVELGALAAVTAISGGLGVYFHLRSRSLADDVSTGVVTGLPWTADLEQKFQDNKTARTQATVAYSVAGVAAIALVVFYIATTPPTERTVLRTARIQPIVNPVAGGGTVGVAWQF